MAIDTAEKRRAASGVGFHPLGPGVTPNADKDDAWRAQAAWGYLFVVEVVLLCIQAVEIRSPWIARAEVRSPWVADAETRTPNVADAEIRTPWVDDAETRTPWVDEVQPGC